MKKHLYVINFNGGSGQNKKRYQFGRVKDIALFIGKNKASIRYESGVIKEQEDFITFKDKLFRDAYRKVHLLHAFIYNFGLRVDKIEIIIDGDSKGYDKSYSSFPFLYSMIRPKYLGLGGAWKDIIPETLAVSKSVMDKDLRFVSVFSFLLAKSKYYETERFSNFWTAMNAYYSYVALCFEKKLRMELGVNENEELRSALTLHGDYQSIGAMCWLIGGKYRSYGKEDTDKLWKRHSVENILGSYKEPQIKKLYEAAAEEADGVGLPAEYADLAACAEELGVSLYAFMLFVYPYHWRCDLFHGNRTPVLFLASTDKELTMLHVVNYFLERFLNESIPKMFDEDFFAEAKYEKVKQYMRLVTPDKAGKSKFDKYFDRMRKVT